MPAASSGASSPLSVASTASVRMVDMRMDDGTTSNAHNVTPRGVPEDSVCAPVALSSRAATSRVIRPPPRRPCEEHTPVLAEEIHDAPPAIPLLDVPHRKRSHLRSAQRTAE
jgi:hypothetical protein